MDFGRRYRIGNFTVIKYNSVLRKNELAELRTSVGIPREVQRNLQRGKMPVIKVEAGSGMCAFSFTPVMSVYELLDTMVCDMEKYATLHHLFTMWFTDVTVPGDEQYQKDKAEALKAFYGRQKAAEVSKEEDDKVLDELRKDEETKATILDMAEEIRRREEEGGSDE